MPSKLRQIIVAAGIVGVALLAAIVAVGLVDPLDARPSASGPAAARPSGNPSLAPRASLAPRPSVPSRSGGPAANDVAVLVGAGDIADCTRPQDELTANVLESLPGIVFTLGDNVEPGGSIDQFHDCYAPTWGRPPIKDRTRPVAGDNDYDNLGAAGYFEYFGDAAGSPDAGYYAYDAGAWRVYALNSNCASIGGCGQESAQSAWLVRDLASEPRKCVLAMWHRPYFTSGHSLGGDSSIRNFWRILHDAGAEIVLNGHDHHYERFAAQAPSGDPDPKGIVQFVVGTGGSRSDDLIAPATNSEARAFDVYGVLRLELSPDGYATEFIQVAGREFSDRSEGKCH